MAQIRMTVRNNTTGKVSYSCVKASGEYDELYSKLLCMANRILNDRHAIVGIYIYGYDSFHWRHARRFGKLLRAFGRPYFEYSDVSYNYTYTII